MTSNLTDQLGSLKLNQDRIRITSPATRRQSGSIQNSRPKLRANRSQTVDHGSQEEKIRIVVLGATKVGSYRFDLKYFILNYRLSLSLIQVKHAYVNNFYNKNSSVIIKKLSTKCIQWKLHLSIDM